MARRLTTREAIELVYQIRHGILWFVDYGAGPEKLILDGIRKEGTLLASCPRNAWKAIGASC